MATCPDRAAALLFGFRTAWSAAGGWKTAAECGDGRRGRWTPQPARGYFFDERHAPMVEHSVRAKAADRMDGMVALETVNKQSSGAKDVGVGGIREWSPPRPLQPRRLTRAPTVPSDNSERFPDLLRQVHVRAFPHFSGCVHIRSRGCVVHRRDPNSPLRIVSFNDHNP